MKRAFFSLLAGCLLGCATQTLATTVAQLQETGRLQVRSWLSPVDEIVPGQQVKLVLEIATDRWFTGGTRIQVPEVPGLVILQTDDFASNSSEQRNGQSWVVQRWSLEVYPQRAGNFTVPAVSASIKVSGDAGDAVTGEVIGPELQFSATRPQSLARAQHWVAAPQYSVSQTFDRDLTGLEVGDAIEREIVFKASEVMAMMLPAFTEDSMPGLRAYPEPPVVKNNSNRGTTVASRTQRLIYIVETLGEYQLPQQDFFWWDTGAGELQLLSLPGVKIHAGIASPAQREDEASHWLNRAALLALAGGVAVSAILLWLARKLALKRHWQRSKDFFRGLLALWRKLRKPGLPAELNPGKTAPNWDKL